MNQPTNISTPRWYDQTPCGLFLQNTVALYDIDRGGVTFFVLDITLHVFYDGLESGKRVSRHRHAAWPRGCIIDPKVASALLSNSS